MVTATLNAFIVELIGDLLCETGAAIYLTQKHHAAVAGDVATRKVGCDFASSDGFEMEFSCGTTCHGKSFLKLSVSN